MCGKKHGLQFDLSSWKNDIKLSCTQAEVSVSRHTFNTLNNRYYIYIISETVYLAYGVIKADFNQTTHCPLEFNDGYILNNFKCRMK